MSQRTSVDDGHLYWHRTVEFDGDCNHSKYEQNRFVIKSTLQFAFDCVVCMCLCVCVCVLFFALLMR